MSLEFQLTGKTSSRPLREGGVLFEGEEFWRDHYKWLQGCGYKLRSRYSPDWIPSWRGTKKNWSDCEDGQPIISGILADATRISDGALAGLKLVHKPSHPFEAEIGLFLSSQPLVSDSTNHCIPIWDVLQVPDDDDHIIIVMPFLRRYGSPRFDTFGEVIEFFRQAIEGLNFMHKHNIAHRDCNGQNTMMDATPLYPEPYHPSDPTRKRDWSGKAKNFTRTQRPVKYYLIDFGISRRYKTEDMPPLEAPIWGGDKTVPEYQTSNQARNPFPVDVYYLGNLIRTNFVQNRYGFEFMRSLVDDMVQDDPTKRPNMEEVAARYDVIRNSLSSWKLRSRVVQRDDWAIFGFFRGIAHWIRRIKSIVMRVPAIPTPPPLSPPEP